jgi:2-phospho-L-lactate/phosphoenolpyruvate guanylyltransferase
MRTLAILPVKSFRAAKQRLAEALGAGSRVALAQAMFADVLTSARCVPGLQGIAVVTSDRVAESAAAGSRDGVLVLREEGQSGHSAAALLGIRRALADGYDRVLLIPGDTPLVQTAELTALLAGATGVVIVPDRHGTGTNALVLTPPDAIEPSFGPGSLERHVAAAEAAGLPYRVQEVPGLALDVDTPDDLAALTAELELSHGAAPATRGALRQLDRAGAQPMRLPNLAR